MSAETIDPRVVAKIREDGLVMCPHCKVGNVPVFSGWMDCRSCRHKFYVAESPLVKVRRAPSLSYDADEALAELCGFFGTESPEEALRMALELARK